ncbi:MAG: hypothetical protein AAF492_19390, partial [Verrucomicrobiota bacterium]
MSKELTDKEFVVRIQQIEKDHPVDRMTFDGLCIWPLVRWMIVDRSKSHLLGKKQNKDDRKFLNWSSLLGTPLKKVGALIKQPSSFGYLLSDIMTSKKPVDILSFTLVNGRDQRVDGHHFSKFSDAFARQIIPGFLCVILLLKTMASQTSVMGGLRGHMDLNLLQILAVDATILWRYMGMLLWPQNLCVLYDVPTDGITGMVTLAIAGWAA